MKIFAMEVDQNGRSCPGFFDMKMNKVSDTEFLSAKQEGTEWRIGTRAFSGPARTSKEYKSAAGPYEMHVGGPPHFVGCMSGNAEITLQDGGAWRLVPGEFLYVRPGALHHSNNASLVTTTIFNLGLPGTPTTTGEYPFK